MSTSALDPYLQAVRDNDHGKLAASLAGDIVMHGPLVIEPITGRDQVAPVLGLAFGAVEGFRFGEILSAPGQYAIAFTGKIGAEDIEGMEHLHLDPQGGSTASPRTSARSPPWWPCRTRSLRPLACRR